MKHTSFVIPLLLTVLLFSCKKDDGGTTPQGGIALSGVVQAFSGAPINGATVQVFSGNTTTGTPAATATSNASGQWQANVSSAGRYTAMISAASFPTAYVSINVPTGQTSVNVGASVLASQRITGTVNDARTGVPIPNALVRFFLGSNNDTSGYRFPDLLTNASGQFIASLTIGTYVYAVYAPNRLPLVTGLSVNDTTATQLTATVTDPVPAGQMRIVLNWGRVPSDLDSHLTGDSTATTGRPRYHVFYANRVVRLANGDTVAYLDVDDVTSYGPETITIYRFFPGTLRYKIHDYSNRSRTGSHDMSDSSAAVVRVYTSAGLIREDRIRTGVAGNQWYVYDINGANQAITFVNTIRDGVVSPTDTSFRPTVLPPKVKQQ
jgi:hypothetical protein